MRALITGINGFVGGHLAERLLASEWEVMGLALTAAVQEPSLRGRVKTVGADLLDAAATRAAITTTTPDVIFHLAAQSHVPTALADPSATITNNLMAQLNLINAVRQLGLEPVIVVACTSEEYGAVRPEDIPVDEDTPLRPSNPYALSKVFQDMLALEAFLEHKVRLIRLRLFNHIGPRQAPSFVVPAFAEQIARIEAGLQEPVVRVGNLAARRDFTDVRDIVRAYELAALTCEPGEVYNIGSGQAVAVGDLLHTLIELSTVRITVEPDPARARPIDVPVIACDATRFHSRTGWLPAVPLEQTLQDVLDEWRARVTN